MMHRRGFVPTLGVVCFSVVTRAALAADDATGEGWNRLRAVYPGVRAISSGEGERALFGRAMNEGPSATKSAASWIADHLDALGDRRSELRETHRHTLGGGRLTVFAFQQYLAGLPVEDGMVRLAVEAGRRNAVVYAAGRMARLGDAGLTPLRVSADQALDAIRSQPAHASLTDYHAASLAILVPEGDFSVQTPVRVWKFGASGGVLANYSAFTFFVDAATGAILQARSEVYHADVEGRVRGLATAGSIPDVAANPPTMFDLPLLSVRSTAEDDSAQTDDQGFYSIDQEDGVQATISAALEGPFVRVNTDQGAPLTLAQAVSAPGELDFLFNQTPSEFSTAQVNGFLQTNVAHEFFKSRQPDFTRLDIQLDCNVNIPSICNATFTPFGPAINFFNAGGGCVNTAYSSIIHHEFGHFIVSEHDLAQGAFGEGYGDTLGILINDDPVVGRDFQGAGRPVRDIAAANKQYPCIGEIHDCGQLLAGVWWDLRLNLGASMGDQAGLDQARQLFTDWTGITIGGRRGNSAQPVTAVEVLTVDDDDANLFNGTPHKDEICDAFAAHGIQCPGGCDAIAGLRLTCRSGSFSIRASVTSDDPAGSVYELTLDQTSTQTVSISRFGRGATRFSGVGEGTHTVCVVGCEEFCETVTCEP